MAKKRPPSKRKRKRGQVPRIPQGEHDVIATDPGAPNLDAKTPHELRVFYLANTMPRTRGKAAQEMFPSKRAGYMRASRMLASYAIQLVAARKRRLAGEIAKALDYEDECGRIYMRLPKWARW